MMLVLVQQVAQVVGALLRQTIMYRVLLEL